VPRIWALDEELCLKERIELFGGVLFSTYTGTFKIRRGLCPGYGPLMRNFV
jgi:hypothetical protein